MRQPLYRQVAAQIIEQIEDGRLGEPAKLPSEADLARRYGVSRPTLREALGALEREGFIAKVHGIGTFVRRRAAIIETGLENFESYTDTIRRQGHKAEDRVLEVTEGPLSQFGLEKYGTPDAKAISIESLRLADGKPVIFCQDVLSPRYASRTTPDDVLAARSQVESMLEYLQPDRDCQLSHAQLSVRAVPAPDEVAERLELTPGFPVLCLTGPSFDVQGNLVYYSRNYFDTDIYAFSFVRRRKDGRP